MKKGFKVLLFYPNTPLFGIAPSNLAILSACLKQAGFEVKLFDCTIYKPEKEETQDDLRAKLGQVKKSNLEDYYPIKNIDIYKDFINVVEEYKPNLIGLSVLDMTITFSLSFIEKIKHKNISVVVGGVGATFGYKKILESRLVNYVCIGEGEETLVELCEKLSKNENCTNIKNIYLKKDGQIIKNSLRPLVDINKLPLPDFSIYEDYRFYRPFSGKIVRMLCMDTDRGCPGNCTYCAAPGLRQLAKENNCGKVYRTKDINKIFEETKILIKKHNIDFLWINAESLLSMPLKRFQEFAEKYKKEIDLPFYCQSRLDTFSEEKTKLLANINCKAIGVGIEHGSEKIRNEILNKHIKNERIIESFKEISKYSMLPNIFNMIGFPDETRENIFETIEINKKISKILRGNHTVNVFTFMPFYGTKLREICLEKGYITGQEDFPITWFKYSILNMPSLSKEEIYGLEKTFVLYVMLPKKYWADIKIAEQENEKGDAMLEKLMMIKMNILNEKNKIN